MNWGYFNHSGDYCKKVSFSKAVIWKDRQLSLRKDVVARIIKRGSKQIKFLDQVKKEKWIFKVEKVLEHGQYKRIGQEEQLYFPIELKKVEPILDRKPPDEESIRTREGLSVLAKAFRDSQAKKKALDNIN